MILRTLQRQPQHGYALAQHIKRMSNDLLQIEEGTLYPALQRSLQAGLVIYRVTAAGKKHLKTQVSSFEWMLEGIQRVLTPEES